jgi:gluconate 5-dehydrogenase
VHREQRESAVTAPPSFSVDGQVALVTGGGTGVGLGVARCLAEAGARVVIAGRRQEVLDDGVAAIGNGAVAIQLDVTALASVPRVIEDIESGIGPIGVLVNNSGNHVKQPAEELSDDDFASVLDVHVAGGFAVTRAVGRHMLARQRGSVIYVSSLNALIGMPEVAAYSAAKAALTGLVRSLAVEWAGRGVRVNAIVPGWVDAGMAKRVLGADQARLERVLARTPMGRLATAEEVGSAAVYLASPAGGFVTGAMIPVDGGAAIGF